MLLHLLNLFGIVIYAKKMSSITMQLILKQAKLFLVLSYNHFEFTTVSMYLFCLFILSTVKKSFSSGNISSSIIPFEAEINIRSLKGESSVNLQCYIKFLFKYKYVCGLLQFN